MDATVQLNISNETVSEYLIPYYFDPLNYILIAVGLTSAAVGLIGNITVLMLIFGSNKFRRPANFFVANLCFTSIIYVLVTILRFYAGRPKDPINEYTFLCHLGAFIPKFTHALIAFTTMAIILDRNYRVSNPMSIPSKTWLLKVILSLWLASVIVTFPRLFMFGIKEFPSEDEHEPSQKKCLKVILWDRDTAQIIYLTLYFSLVTLLPITTSVFGLLQILRVIKGYSSCQKSPKGTRSRSSNSIRFRVLRNTFIFSILFIIGWGPSGVVMYLTDFPPSLMPDLIGHNFSFFKYFNIVGFVQNSLNPILLFVLSSDLRQYVYRTKERLCHV